MGGHKQKHPECNTAPITTKRGKLEQKGSIELHWCQVPRGVWKKAGKK